MAALRLGHRTSVDFDFFSDGSLNREVLNDSFSFIKHSTLLQDQKERLSLLVPYGDTEHVKVSFFWRDRFWSYRATGSY